MKTYRDVAAAYLAGKRYVKTETVNETLDGRRIDVILQITFTSRMKESGRALVTALSVTEQKNADGRSARANGNSGALWNSPWTASRWWMRTGAFPNGIRE